MEKNLKKDQVAIRYNSCVKWNLAFVPKVHIPGRTEVASFKCFAKEEAGVVFFVIITPYIVVLQVKPDSEYPDWVFKLGIPEPSLTQLQKADFDKLSEPLKKRFFKLERCVLLLISIICC